ncbi:MAG: hypothetical protein Q9220_005770 [cf. Caloplaca sp. 1 TL-2023]
MNANVMLEKEFDLAMQDFDDYLEFFEEPPTERNWEYISLTLGHERQILNRVKALYRALWYSDGLILRLIKPSYLEVKRLSRIESKTPEEEALFERLRGEFTENMKERRAATGHLAICIRVAITQHHSNGTRPDALRALLEATKLDPNSPTLFDD